MLVCTVFKKNQDTCLAHPFSKVGLTFIVFDCPELTASESQVAIGMDSTRRDLLLSWSGEVICQRELLNMENEHYATGSYSPKVFCVECLLNSLIQKFSNHKQCYILFIVRNKFVIQKGL